MKNKITLTIQDPDAKRLEYFLNAVKDELTEIPFEWRSWKRSDCIHAGCKFISTQAKDKVTITVLFCSYADAKIIAEANGLPYLPIAKWGQNGGLMYFVESENAEKVMDILSLFAGEE